MTARPIASDIDRSPAVTTGAPRILGVHWAAWLFVGLAIGDVVLRFARGEPPTPYLSVEMARYLLAITPIVCVLLLPAALLIRHPDAWTTAWPMLIGMVLMAAVEGLGLIGEVLADWFAQVTPPNPGIANFVPLNVLFGAGTSLVGSIGLLCVAYGLDQARRYEDRDRTPSAWILVAVAVIVGVALTATVGGLELGNVDMTAGLALYFASFVTLGVINAVAWTSLTLAAGAGRRAGEDPPAGWLLAFLGGLLVVVAIAIFTIQGLGVFTNASVLDAADWLRTVLFAVGHLCLLAAFVVGLPDLGELDEAEPLERPGIAASGTP